MKSGAIIIFCLMTGLITNCWSAETMKQFRVSDYGAKGDGKIDDFAAERTPYRFPEKDKQRDIVFDTVADFKVGDYGARGDGQPPFTPLRSLQRHPPSSSPQKQIPSSRKNSHIYWREEEITVS